jgi:hypothetical protein
VKEGVAELLGGCGAEWAGLEGGGDERAGLEGGVAE